MKLSETNKIWVLTFHINEYNQLDSGYFLCAFKSKPTKKDLLNSISTNKEDTNSLELTLKSVDKLIDDGGGRIGFENLWYNLKELDLL